MARARTAAATNEVTAESINKELADYDITHSVEGEESTYMRDLWEHRTQSESFVRAFAWARKRGNQLKGCLTYADAHELNHEDSDAPVKIED